MPSTMLLDYPEFFLAAIAAGMFLIFGIERNGQMSVPVWLSGPAVSIISLLPEKYLHWLSQKLIWSGWRSNTAFGALATTKVFLPFAALLAFFLFLQPALLLAAISLFVLPDLVLLRTSKRRQEKIKEMLPQALDLMILCVDAGLGLDATLQKIAAEKSKIVPALNEELEILGRDILLGMDRERAYEELFSRTGVEELKALASSLNQSAKLGISIAKTLRNQAEYLRMKLTQKAEEKAAKLPIYMAFPLWFCIMPALFVILLAPSLITFFEKAPTRQSSSFR